MTPRAPTVPLTEDAKPSKNLALGRQRTLRDKAEPKLGLLPYVRRMQRRLAKVQPFFLSAHFAQGRLGSKC